MPAPYTGSTEDTHAIDLYLERVMEWIDELKEKYGLVDRPHELTQN
jgi:hypothetical protein